MSTRKFISIFVISLITALGISMPTWMVDGIIGLIVPNAQASSLAFIPPGQWLNFPHSGGYGVEPSPLMYDSQLKCYCYKTEAGTLRIPRCHSRHLLVVGKTTAPICEDRDTSLVS